MNSQLIEEVLIIMGTKADFDDELILAMGKEIQAALNEKKCEGTNKDSEEAKAEKEKQKKVIINVLEASVRTQRLYFVVRSAIMSLLSALIAFIIVGFIGAINVVQVFFLGIFLFLASLVISRLFDKQIIKVSKKIVRYLERHNRTRTFVLKNL